MRVSNKHLLKNRDGGVGFILVTWILVALIAIVGEFTYTMRTELNIVRNFKEEEESYQLALAGIEQAKLEILSAKEPAYVYKNAEDLLSFKRDEEEIPSRSAEIGNNTFSYTITDEDSKLNINKVPLEQLKNIIQGTGIDISEVDTIVDSIIDWRDTNDLHMLNGAEEDYYQSLEIPYSCKDGPFEIIEELLLVKGVTPEIFYGTGNTVDEEDADNGEEEYFHGIARYFTAFNTMKININTASQEVLETAFGTEKANNILIQREESPILTPISGGAVTSSFFTIISTGSTLDGKIKRTVKATLKKAGKKLEVIYWNDNFIG